MHFVNLVPYYTMCVFVYSLCIVYFIVLCFAVALKITYSIRTSLLIWEKLYYFRKFLTNYSQRTFTNMQSCISNSGYIITWTYACMYSYLCCAFLILSSLKKCTVSVHNTLYKIFVEYITFLFYSPRVCKTPLRVA